jgi:hypothetical protein
MSRQRSSNAAADSCHRRRSRRTRETADARDPREHPAHAALTVATLPFMRPSDAVAA